MLFLILMIASAIFASCGSGKGGLTTEPPINIQPPSQNGIEPKESYKINAPILLILADAPANPYQTYLAEILRAEGLTAYETIALNQLVDATLDQRAVVILPEIELNAQQVSLFKQYLSMGGRMIAMRPDKKLSTLVDLTAIESEQDDGYLVIDEAMSEQLSVSLPTSPMQIHGAVTRYENKAPSTSIAGLQGANHQNSGHSAIVSVSYGQGELIVFAYDLAKNIALTRQGNPANADIDTDQDGVVRTIDLFQGQNGSQPWIDRDLIHIAQADEQQRLFAVLIKTQAQARMVLPSFWYFPNKAKTILVNTSDAHANPTSYFQHLTDDFASYDAQCTFYVSIAGDPDNATAEAWRSAGHTFGLHPRTQQSSSYPPHNFSTLTQGYTVMDDWFSQMYSSAKSRTVRNHQVAWKGWTTAAEIAVAHGIELDTNFYHWGPWIKKNNNTWPHGYITGSGRPMKFVKSDGTVLNIYQQLTELVDEQLLQAVSGSGYEKLDTTKATLVSKDLIDASIAGDYAAITTQFHVDYCASGEARTWLQQTLAYAKSKDIPMWNADRWLAFTQTRHDATFRAFEWDPNANAISFTVHANNTSTTKIVDIGQLTVVLPQHYQGKTLSTIVVDKKRSAYSPTTLKNQAVVWFDIPTGEHHIVATYN